MRLLITHKEYMTKTKIIFILDHSDWWMVFIAQSLKGMLGDETDIFTFGDVHVVKKAK